MQHYKWITLGFSALCLIAVATVLKAEHLYYMAAILLTLPGVSYSIGWYTLLNLEITRELPETAWEGGEAKIRYRVLNRSRVAKYFLSISERFPQWITKVDETLDLFNISSEAEYQHTIRVQLNKRGCYQVQTFEVTALDPLGIFAFTKSIACEGELVVYPRPVPVPAWIMTSGDQSGWMEVVRQALRGSSVDPDGVRPYVAGDSLRRIHWRQTARTGQLSVIEFEEDKALNLIIALDTLKGSEVGSGSETTLEYGIRLAASVADEAIRQGGIVQLLLPQVQKGDAAEIGTGIPFTSGRGLVQLHCILYQLAGVEADSQLGIETTLNHSLESIDSHLSLFVITSREGPELNNILLKYQARGIHVTHAYIDPNSFAESHRNSAQTVREMPSGAETNTLFQKYLLRRHPDGLLYPETTTSVTLN